MTNNNYSEFIKRIDEAQQAFKNVVIKDLKELITKAIEKEGLGSLKFTFYYDDGWWFSCEIETEFIEPIIMFDTDSNFDKDDFPEINKYPYTLEVCNILNDLFAAEENPDCLIDHGYYKADHEGFYFKGFFRSEWKKGWY